MDDETFARDLITDIYASVREPALVQSVADQLYARVGCGSVYWFTPDLAGPERSFVAYRDHAGDGDAYLHCYEDLDAWHHKILEHDSGAMTDATDRYFSNICTCVLAGETEAVPHVGIYRQVTDQPFDQREVDLLTMLIPHFQQWYVLTQQLNVARKMNAVLADALDNLNFALLMVDVELGIVKCNRRAETILTQGDGLCRGQGSLRCSSSSDTEALLRLVSNACSDAVYKGQQRSGGATRITRPSGKEPFAVHVSPLGVATQDPGDSHCALVLIFDPGRTATAPEEVIQVLLGLTPAESHVALGLFHGKGVKDLAGQTSVTENTMRTHIRRILDKTDTNRQSELVSLLARTLAPIEN